MPPPTSIPYTPTTEPVACTSMDHQLKCVVDTMVCFKMGGGREIRDQKKVRKNFNGHYYYKMWVQIH
jgi:hypothetical protein